MYSLLHETDEATSVNLSVSGKFLPGRGRQLVTVGAKCLKMYRFNPYAIVQEKENFSQTTKMECILSCSLMAPVQSLGVARIPLYPNCDSLIMSFNDAKLSIVNVNPKTMLLNTLSLHSIEDEFLRDGYMKDICLPELRVDPGQRCVSFLVYGRHLAIVPFAESKDQHLQSYTFPLRAFDERLENVIDMAFLDGYYEPTLLFVYEPIKTTAGRACVRYDTVSILGVSLNVKDRVHAIVWNFGGIPMDVVQCLAVPMPIGGICLFGTNEIIYLNQSVPPCGMALNSCAEDYCKFPLTDHKHMALSLDGCVAQVESVNTIFVLLRTGELYTLTLDIDSANAVKSMQFKKVFETSIPCSLTVCSPGYLFVGSRLGDSVLLRYKKTAMEIISNCNAETLLVSSPNNDASMKGELDEEDLFLYSNIETEKDGECVLQFDYHFDVLDAIINVGPCKVLRCCTATDIPHFLRKKSRNLAFNLVTVSGHEKDSSLCFYERTIRPDVMTSSSLSDADQFWSVGRREDDSHRYLIIAKEVSTLVLELENDMVELERPIFITSDTTVAAGELANGSIAVQVTAMNIVLVGGDQQLQMIDVDSNFPVITASIVDPFITLLTQNGKLLLYRLDSTYSEEYLKPHEHSPVTSICIYKDISGIVQTNTFTRVAKEDTHIEQDVSFRVRKEEGNNFATEPNDIDELLYGDIKKIEAEDTKKGIENPEIETDVQNPNHVMPTYWMCITRETGCLYIYSIPDIQLVYLVKKFNQLHEILFDDIASALEDDQQSHYNVQPSTSSGIGLTSSTFTQSGDSSKSNDSVVVRAEEIVMELQMHGMGMNQSRPILSALIDDTVVFYEMFPYDEGGSGVAGHLSIRFRRLNCCCVTRHSRFLGPNGRANVESARDTERHRPLIHPFEQRIGKISSGIFISGGYPSFFIMERGEPRLHPMTIDGPIISFAAFNNSNCPNGLLYLTYQDRIMRIAMLQSDINYDASYPFKKVSLSTFVHSAVYLLQPGIFGVITSVKHLNNKQCIVVNEDKQMETIERDQKFILPAINRFTLKLFSTENWEFVPNADFEFDEFEIVTCMEEVLLSSESTVSGVQSYLAVGTAYNYGEEVFVRGRILLCEIIDVVPEEGLPTTRHRLKVVYNKEQKGPVTSICSCKGYLLTGMGQKVFIWQFRDNELNGVSFLDLHFYVHHLVGFRDLALGCDLYRSLSLIRYQEEFKALSLVSRDLRPTAPPPMVAQFMIDHKQLAFVMSDEAGNITVFNYLPETKESMGGERLIIRASLNIGSMVNAIVRVKGHVGECFIENEAQVRETQSCIFATLDGSFGVVRPLFEKVFRRLHMLQQVMTMHVPQPVGLNPRGARAARPAHTHTNQQISSARNILDGAVVFQYLYLSTPDKTDLARKLGTSRYQIMDDLVEISRITTHY